MHVRSRTLSRSDCRSTGRPNAPSARSTSQSTAQTLQLSVRSHSLAGWLGDRSGSKSELSVESQSWAGRPGSRPPTRGFLLCLHQSTSGQPIRWSITWATNPLSMSLKTLYLSFFILSLYNTLRSKHPMPIFCSLNSNFPLHKVHL